MFLHSSSPQLPRIFAGHIAVCTSDHHGTNMALLTERETAVDGGYKHNTPKGVSGLKGVESFPIRETKPFQIGRQELRND